MRHELRKICVVAQELENLLRRCLDGDGLLNVYAATRAEAQQFAYMHICECAGDQTEARKTRDSAEDASASAAVNCESAARSAHGQAGRGCPPLGRGSAPNLSML